MRSLMSGIFSHAAALGQIEYNPMRDAKVLGKVKPPSSTPHYSLGELEDAISALADDPAAQTVIALSGFLGLRPSEIVSADTLRKISGRTALRDVFLDEWQSALSALGWTVFQTGDYESALSR